MTDPLDRVFGALADPTRRFMVESLLREGVATVPALARGLPISRQAVAKHLTTLDEAGLVERIPGAGRAVRYRLREDALGPASSWLRAAEAAWDGRLARLKASVEDAARRDG